MELQIVVDNPMIAPCGNDCNVCPKYTAKSSDDLLKAAKLWYRLGWSDKITSPEETKCSGCSSSRRTCPRHRGNWERRRTSKRAMKPALREFQYSPISRVSQYTEGMNEQRNLLVTLNPTETTLSLQEAGSGMSQGHFTIAEVAHAFENACTNGVRGFHGIGAGEGFAKQTGQFEPVYGERFLQALA